MMDWQTFKDAWSENRSAIETLRRAPLEEGTVDHLGFLVPIASDEHREPATEHREPATEHHDPTPEHRDSTP